MATYEYSVPDATCSVCTGTIDRALEDAQKNNQLQPRIRSVNIDLSYEPPRAFVVVDTEGKENCDLQLMSGLPQDLKKHKDSFILVNNQLCYITFNGKAEPVKIDNFDQFSASLKDMNKDESPIIHLSKEQENKLITSNGGYARLGHQAIKTELNTLLEDVGFTFTQVEPVKTEIRKHVLKGLLGLLSGSLMLGLCISGLGLPLLAMYTLSALGTALTLYLGKDTYKEAFKKLKKKELTMHTLFSISTLMALGVTLASFFVPWLPMMLDTALLIFGFVHIGKAYEKSTKRSINSASSYRSLAPTKILAGVQVGQFEEAFVNTIQPGRIVRIPRGQVIGLDGRYLPEEGARKNTTIINPYKGSNLPQVIKPGETILAGSIVPEDVDFIQLEVSASEEESYLAFLEKQSKSTLSKKAPLETFAAKLLQYFVPTVLVLATLSALAIGILFTPLTALQVAATILASACPCTLGLIIPLAIKVGFLKANTQGVQFANGETLQAAQEVDTVVFDLNGTLTTGEIRVTSGLAQQAPTNLSAKMLDHLAAIEQLSEHPFAQAIRQYLHGELRRPKEFLPPVALKEKLHSGLIATIRGETYIVGNKDLMLEQGFQEEEISAANILGHEAEHVVYLARGRKIQGCILLSDPLRKEAPEVIRELQNQGKQVHICTGAGRETAERYARKLERLGGHPIPSGQIAANCLPDSKDEEANTKTAYINRLNARGRKVAMIGDGLNDSRAFETSHFSIAIESANGHQITQDKAGAVIHKTNNQLSLRPVLSAFTIANQTVRNIKQNLAISLSYNLLTAFAIGGLLVGLGFVLNPAIGAALMFIQSALILANLQRFKKQTLPYANDRVLEAKEKLDWESTHNRLRRELPYPQPGFKPEMGATVAYEEKTKSMEFFTADTKENSQAKKLFRSASNCQIANRLAQPQ